jgi:superfamily II DNA helicase RecQ
MRAKVLTLRFSPTLSRFDDAALVSLQQKVVLEQMREHLVTVGGEPMLVCVATWREKAVVPGDEPRPVAAAAHAPASPPAPPPPDTPRGPARPVGELREELTGEQQTLFDRLRRWRSDKAHSEGAPPYVVLTNRQLVEIVRIRPHSRTALSEIHGLGDKKVARHGTEILAMLWPDAPPAEAPDVVADAAVAEAVS